MLRVREFVVAAEDAGTRCDVYLARQIPDVSRSQVQRLIRAGLVTRGGRDVRKPGEAVEASDLIRVRIEREELRAAPEDLPLEILYEDSDLVVVNKSAGMVVHIGAGVKSGTLVNALLHHIGALSTAGGELRPGIVHRLDRMTSGLVVVAKNDFTHRGLAAQFKGREVHKTYLLLVHGRVAKDSGEISKPVGRDPVRRVRMKVGGIRPREALTRYRVERRFAHFTLLEAEPRTGRTHQIRVHFASLGHPVVGDTLYGAPAKLRLGGREEKTLPRTFLHAATLGFRHPRGGELMTLRAPLPEELENLLKLVADKDR
ncbi:MAG: RluA family pseudouridine synthase [Acidobacteriia bacterium]|nr:RluA family pseudouridine synthase [Terriglobia bacterium]